MVNLTDGSTRQSMFIQCSSINQSFLYDALEHIRREHKDRSKEDYIYNVTLNEIGDKNGLHTQVLDFLSQYLPGGTRQVFDNVFVGSHFIPWTGAGHAYREGILDPSYRWQNLNVQKKLWEDFSFRYSTIPFHFYIDYEAVLNIWDEPGVRSAFEAYLIQSVKDCHDVWPDRAILYSPAIWSGTGLTNAEEAAIAKTFQNVEYYAKRYGHDRGIRWLHFQDVLGRGWDAVTKSDVVQWYHELKDLYHWDSLRVNMEMFRKGPNGSLIPMTQAQYAEMANFYDTNNIPVGSSWELRWWYPGHTEI